MIIALVHTGDTAVAQQFRSQAVIGFRRKPVQGALQFLSQLFRQQFRGIAPGLQGRPGGGIGRIGLKPVNQTA